MDTRKAFSAFSAGNIALRSGAFAEAIQHYSEALLTPSPDIDEIQFNLAYARMQYFQSCENMPHHAAVLAAGLPPEQSRDHAIPDVDEGEVARALELRQRVQHYLRRSAGKKNKIVVYTAITNNRDVLKIPKVLCDDFDYVCFTDRLSFAGIHPWRIRRLEYFTDPARTIAFVKANPHLLLPEYEVSVWIDAGILIKTNALAEMVDAFIKNGDSFAAAPHPTRDCAYAQADVRCAEYEAALPLSQEQMREYTVFELPGLPIIALPLMQDQMRQYTSEQFPDKFGLLETDVLIRRHSLPAVRHVGKEWWNQINRWSDQQDELALMYALWKHSLSWRFLLPKGRSLREHPGFSFHRQGLRTTPDASAYAVPKFLPDSFAYDVWPFWAKQGEIYDPDTLRAFENTPVDIVVCIHNALPHVRACLESLEKTLLPTHRLILVDDGSEKETAGYLEAFASRKDTVLLMRNDAAIGYTKSANLGLRLSSAPFVILLNSDTIVSRNWALKLLQAAYSRPHIGIVGPMSNAASYQSVPYVRDPRVNRLAVNDLPQNMTVEDVDRWCEENAYFGLFPLTQLINGFCYGIKREVIEHIGYLDEEGFPIGYGEEDDYSLRALKAGFMHAVATHCYVYHAKSKSFGDKRRGAMASSARQTLRDKHGELRLRAAVVTSESNPLLAAIRYKFCRLVGLPFAGAKIARLNLPTYGNEVFEPVIAVVCSSDPRQARMPPSAHIRLLERIRSNPGGIHAFRRMHAEELLAAVKEGKIRAALIQRTHMPANIWEKLKPYAASGQLRYLLDLDDDLLHVPAHKDPQKIYESYRPVLTDIIRHAAIVTVSTERLYQKVAALAARVALLPNGLSRRIWGGELPQHSPDKIFRVLYMGSKTHDADLRMLMPALERVAARHSEFRLSLVGVVHEKFTNPPRWMECVAIPEEATEYPLFILWLKQQAGAFDCGIAPLEGMDFNANKSPLKVLEYAGLGLPVLASAGSVYGELQGQAPFMVLVEDDPSAWEYALLDMNAKRASLPEQGLAMREWVLREHALDRYADIFDEHITALMP